MKIIIPMAGMGWRFIKEGYNIPKPLIKVDGKPIIQHIIELFPGEEDFIFICNKQHLKETEMRSLLQKLKPKSQIIEIDYQKKGPVYGGVILVEEYVPDKEPVILSYCDYSLVWDYEKFKKTINESNVDSISVCYKGFHPHLIGPNLYAGVKTWENNLAIEVKEKHSYTKDKMETWQQAGLFYFKTGEILKKYARKVYETEEAINGEHYISQLFTPMIKEGLNSLVYPVETFIQWGTPQDLEEYESWSYYIHKKLGKDKPETTKPLDRDPINKLNLTPEEFEKTLYYWKKYFETRKL